MKAMKQARHWLRQVRSCNYLMEQSKNSDIGKREIVSLFAIYVVYGLAQASNEFRTLFLKSQGLSATECGRVLAAASLLTAFAGPVASAMADKLRSRRTVYLISASAWLVFLIALLLTRHYQIAGFALCAGIMPFINVCDPVTYNMIEASGVNASMRVQKLDFSIIRVSLSLGYCLINFAYTPLVARFGPSAPFLCTAVFVAILLLLSGTLKTFETEQKSNVKEKKKLELGRIFTSYYLITFLILGLILSLGNCTGPYLVYLMNDINMDTSLVGTASGIRVAGEILLMISLPLIKKKVSIPLLQAFCVAGCTIQTIIYLTSRNPYVILAALAIGGAAGGIGLGTRAVYLRNLAPEGLDTLTITLFSTMNCVGNVIMNLIGGIIVDKQGIYALYRVSLIFMAAWIVLYFASWAFGKYVLKKEPPMPMFRVFRQA